VATSEASLAVLNKITKKRAKILADGYMEVNNNARESCPFK
jgi:hypothetical protein